MNINGYEIAPEADLCWADLTGADLKGVDLSRANLRKAILHRANLFGAKLQEANLSKASLQWGATLRKANLRGATLREADLDETNLHAADLRGADLWRASLQKANLSGADLREANLHGADLRGADLCGANLRGATLSETSLNQANIAASRDLIDGGQDSRGYRFVAVSHDDGLRIKAGCRWHALAEARIHWGPGSYSSNASECLAKVEMMVAEARRRGWPEPAGGWDYDKSEGYGMRLLAAASAVVADKEQMGQGWADKIAELESAVEDAHDLGAKRGSTTAE